MGINSCQKLQVITVTILGCFLRLHSPAHEWALTSASTRAWKAVACSADGSTILAASKETFGGSLYSSVDSGATWVSNSLPSMVWNSVAVSPDGRALFAAGSKFGGAGVVFTSTNAGSTWQSNGVPAANNITSIAVSSDGKKVYLATFYGGTVLVSTNQMASWNLAPIPNAYWITTACSRDGGTVFAAADAGLIYASTNSGSSWWATSAPSEPWSLVACSPDGRKVIASAFLASGGGVIYSSTNAGTDWISNDVPVRNWTSTALSVDGQTMVASCSLSPTSPVYTSIDAGKTWAPGSGHAASDTNWFTVSISADGNRAVGCIFNGGIYRTYAFAPPRLNVAALADRQVGLSWTVLSTNFVLQRSFGLVAMPWTVVDSVPFLNPTSVQNQVVLSATNANCYFRLAVP